MNSPSLEAPQSSSPILRNIAVSFLLLTALLGGIIAYVSLSRATIVVTLQPVARDVTFRTGLKEQALGEVVAADTLPATFLETTTERSDTFTPSGEAKPTGKAGGTVTLHNETGSDQPLVATTRLLTSDGVLFRIKSAVRVPAGGTVDVVAEADQEGTVGEIGPSRFTIPGLNATLQKTIYAISTTPMVRGGAVAKEVSAQDLETARQTLRKQIIDEAAISFSTQVGEGKLTPQDFVTETVSETSSAKVGEAAANFTLQLQLRVIGVMFDKGALLQKVASETGGQAPAEQSLVYSINNYNSILRTATLSGKAIIGGSVDKSSSIFSPQNFTGVTPVEAEAFLKNYEGIQSVEVKISPFWQKHLPRIPSRIEVELKQA